MKIKDSFSGRETLKRGNVRIKNNGLHLFSFSFHFSILFSYLELTIGYNIIILESSIFFCDM